MKTLIVAILDRSGSMWGTIDDAIGGINAFLEEQGKLPGYCEYEEVLFDTEQIVSEPKDILTCQKHTRETYVPRGGTALLDAIGTSITRVGERLAKMSPSERPDKVIFSILTDGHENMSREYSKEKVAEMIEHQTSKYSWEFIYLAADKIGASYGKSLGVARSFSYEGDTKMGFTAYCSEVTSSRI